MKVALVTGGARRIGAALVKKLHEAHYNVVIHCHQSEPQAKILAQELNLKRPNSALVIQEDLHSMQAVTRLIEKTTHWQNRLDLLINNASIFLRTNLTEINRVQPKGGNQKYADDFLEEQLSLFDENWSSLFDVNAKVPFFLSLRAYPHLAQQKGCIINLTDIHADKPLKGYAIYCQAKAALSMQTKVLAREFAPQVRVNAIAPGAIVWPENENELSDEAKEVILAKTPLKRHGDPQFIAQALLALVENLFITGQILAVDGGRSIV